MEGSFVQIGGIPKYFTLLKVCKKTKVRLNTQQGQPFQHHHRHCRHHYHRYRRTVTRTNNHHLFGTTGKNTLIVPAWVRVYDRNKYKISDLYIMILETTSRLLLLLTFVLVGSELRNGRHSICWHAGLPAIRKCSPKLLVLKTYVF